MMKNELYTFVKHNIGENQANRGDCVARAISRASGIPYYIVHRDLAEWCRREPRRRGNPSSGISCANSDFRSFMRDYGFQWFEAEREMYIDDVPAIGNYCILLDKHMTSLCSGRLYDTFDPRKKPHRGRIRLGFWLFTGAKLSK